MIAWIIFVLCNDERPCYYTWYTLLERTVLYYGCQRVFAEVTNRN